MTDRELLEAAARAAGMEHMRYAGPHIGMVRMIDPSRPESTGSVGPNWNPLTDDGQALRLAGKLRLRISISSEYEYTEAQWFPEFGKQRLPGGVVEQWGEDRDAATRRAIVRAAAALGSAE